MRLTILPSQGASKLKMALIFLDESGHFSSTDCVCLAGYLASDAGWDSLCQQWKLLLEKHHLPAVHMREIMSEEGKSPAAKWKMEDKLAMLSDFIMVIRKTIHTGFGVSLKSQHYRVLVQSAEQEAKKLGIRTKPFRADIFCVARMIRMILSYFSEQLHSDEYLALTFDDAEQYSMKCYRFISDLKKRNAQAKKSIVAVTFADDAVSYPLQAADVLAFATCNELKKGGKGWLDTNIFTDLLKAEDPAYGLPYRSEPWDERSDDDLMKAIVQEMIS